MIIRQRGTTKPIVFTLVQNGKVITGTAVTIARTGSGSEERRIGGTVDGTLDGDTFSVQIFWPGNLTGVYNAKVLSSGRLDGETYDKNKSTMRQTWYSEGVLKCAPPPVQLAPRPKPIKSSGKARVVTPAPALKPPFITAGQVIGQPLVPFASVFMGWDGGPDHPNVEVFVSIDNGSEIPAFSIDYPPQHPVFKQPKVPAIEMKLSKGRHYKYVLKDAGTTLSTVEFYVP